MRIKQLTTLSGEILNKINNLLPILSDNVRTLKHEELEEMINDKNTVIFIAEEDEDIVGMLVFIIYKLPSGVKAWIEDVIVKEEQQGRGIGRMLVETAIEYAKKLNIKKIDLTSSPFRIAANILYPKLGFKKRDTNVYRLEL
ncbi:GNAT family N-acetyltransferase [Bacteroidales bacterium OttesenSCG-928-K03]|nr:GNAT family N-acetyltransferase [Bacteroidales bacterium OttesenSCG-928-L14]MDL2240847.1 GNAT family N-acetyltransferase [Bacteroidales bacterium OttesenSCG-928-K22]MDL2242801.1 GNAT family N-acetyltransferase [Bacteroidales bacterium OttesenSCG-928-K03]